ncbi:MAG: hypothetical protein ATN35_07135 [Epulopiscium sp. Nele67-Bin004]|nr:MAG: hypothetical protein ATN35_07135 [Epulopiscium sp. Nele67-Bin004]
MPGHKFGQQLEGLPLLNLDATEATGLDNLYEAEGIIKDAMQYMSDFYGSYHTVFLTNGSTAGILTAILTVCKQDDKILVARNCHYSVWNALVLSGAKPVYITPKYVNNIIESIDPYDVEQAILMYPDIKAMILVSPTYEGIVSDISSIKKSLGDRILIVDEAHGAHLVLDKNFPQTSISQGSDIVIHSLHKTLPALTQSALIHICSNKVSYEDIIKNLKLTQTSSPSYLMMATMDYARAYLMSDTDKISLYIKKLLEIRNKLRQLKHLKLLDEKPCRYDISKIVIITEHSNLTGYQLAQILEDKYNLGIEAAYNTHIILITTIVDCNLALDRLCNVLIEIDLELYQVDKELYTSEIPQEICTALSPRYTYYLESVWQDIENIEGCICAQNIMFYPPGIPLICIGEIFVEEHIKLIQKFSEKLKGIQIENGIIKILTV